eukprot:49298-Rhodomonas_salina.1
MQPSVTYTRNRPHFCGTLQPTLRQHHYHTKMLSASLAHHRTNGRYHRLDAVLPTSVPQAGFRHHLWHIIPTVSTTD